MNKSKLDIVIFDQTESCPYLEGEVARMPLRMPIGPVSQLEIDYRLAEGHRRTGEFVYQTQCPTCQACQPIRIKCEPYRFSKSAKRVIRNNDRFLEQRLSELVCDQPRIDLFNKHRRLRGLAKQDVDIDREEYEWGFVKSCFSSFEISYWDEGRLVAVAICDQGQTAMSAVYTYYDPDYASHGIGTYSILKQIEYCQQRDIEYLYLGYYVADSPHMKYKARFLPQERLIGNQWVKFEK
ncbi:MAG: arginyltransferase [Planctomycetota bacterium]